MRCLAGLQCWRSRLRQDCSQSRSPGQVAAQLGLRPQTCSPSPCLQQGANLTLPARLRRQQGAPPGTASALVTPLVACSYPAAAACQHLPTTTVMACHTLQRWRATSGAKKGWAGIRPGALLVLEARSKEVGTRSVHRALTRRSCLNGAGKACAVSSPSPLPCEHRKAVPPRGTTNNEARTDAGPALALRCNDKARHA
jgi:hypothetical protein